MKQTGNGYLIPTALIPILAVLFLILAWNTEIRGQFGEKPEPVEIPAADTQGIELPESLKGIPTGPGTCDFGGASAIEVQASAGTVGPTGYTTLKAAFDAINAGTHTGTITIDVCGNTTETASAVLNNTGSGSASYTSLLVRPVGSARIIEGTIAGAVVKLNGADAVTIDGRISGVGTARSLTIRNNSTAAATAALWLASVAAGNGASNNIVRNLEIAAGQTANLGTNTTIGVYMGGTTISLTSTDGNDNDGNQFLFNRVTRARYGIASRGVTTNNNEGLIITDNTIGPTSFGADEIGKAGIYLQADTGAIVSRNTVQFVGGDVANLTSGADRCGICIGGENWSVTDSTTITSGDYTVTKNVIHDIVEELTFSAMGIKIGTTRSGSATNNLIANNFIYNVRADGTSGDQAVGIGYSNGHTDRIVFNSIAMTGDFDPGASGAASTYGNAIRVSQANGTNNVNLTLMDNSIYLDVNSNTATVHYYAITLNSSAYVFGTGGLNFNNYFINQSNTQLRTGGLATTGTGGTAATEFQTLANWQAALTAPQDANSIQANPLYFATPGDLHIQGTSPNINVGTTIAGVADDIDAQVRPNGASADIGADEFYPSPGALQFSSATYSQTEVGGTATITVTRTGGASGAISVNFGTSDGSAVGGISCAAGIDYVINSGTLNWSDGDLASKTFPVTLCNDGVAKGSETINLGLNSPGGGATLGSPGSAVLTILNSTTFGSSVNVGTGQGITSLTNPGGLFEQINNGVLTTNLTVSITSDLTAETGSIALNQFAGGFTLTLQPSGGARIISGGSATALINLNGADGVTVNGLNSGGNSLMIRNTAAGPSVLIINDASNNVVQNNTLESGSNSSVISINTGITTGNDNNQIVGNIIRDRTDAAGVPFNSINLIGTSAAISNSNTLIDSNQIINFLQAGIVIGTSDNVTFTNNDISQTASRTTSIFGVAVNTAAGTNLFSQNSVHAMSTTLNASGMQFNDVRGTTVSRNKIYDFPSTSGSTGSLFGLVFNGASGLPSAATFVNNMVSIIPTFTNAQNIRGLFDFSFGGNTFSAFYNTIVIGGTGSGTANTWACKRGDLAPTAFTMIDNICFNARTGGTGNHFAAADQSSNTGTFVSNFNIFVGTGATAANFFDKATSSTSVPASFATWQAGPPTRDANSQAANPGGNFTIANMFTSATDLHLANLGSNPASNTGTPVAGVTTDIDNETRHATTPDIGADEINIAPAAVIVSGRITSTAGRAVGGALVYLIEQDGTRRVAMSSSFGYYQFFNVLTQQNISISPSSKRHTCSTNAFFLSGAATSDFVCTGTP